MVQAQHLGARWAPGAGPIGPDGDVLFRLDPVSEAALLAAGGRLSGDFGGYFAPGTLKAPLVPGPFGRLGVGQAVGPPSDDPYRGPALVIPVDGLVSEDELTVVLWVRALRPPAAPRTVLDLQRHVHVRAAAAGGGGVRLTADLRPSGVSVSLDLPRTGDEWQPVVVSFDGRDLSLSLPHADLVATTAAAVPTEPVSGNDAGLCILPGAVEAPELEVAELVVLRSARTPGLVPVVHGAAIRVDLTEDAGTLSPQIAGALALYTGYRPAGPDGVDPDVGTKVRDLQLAAVGAAGIPLIRLGGVVSGTTIIDEGPGAEPRFSYDFTDLDERLAPMVATGACFHFTLDFNVPHVGGGVLADPPADPEAYAELCSAVFSHLKATCPVASVTLWNEPDIEAYWTGTAEEFHALWEAVQRRFLTDHPEHLLGTGDFAMAANTVAHLEAIAAAGLPVSAAYFHTYDQDLAAVRAEVQLVRSALDRLGFADAPVRLTEWGLDIISQGLRYATDTAVNRVWPNHFRTAHAAAYCLAFLTAAVDADPLFDMGAFSCIGAVDHGLVPQESWSLCDEAMLSEDDPPYAFPSLGAMALLWRLGTRRVAASGTWPNLHALATSEDGVTTVVFGSYRPWQGVEEQLVTFGWAGLPDRFAWTLWRCDDRTWTGRLDPAASGDETDLPVGVHLAGLSVWCIEITAR
jgi:hypothetical protein